MDSNVNGYLEWAHPHVSLYPAIEQFQFDLGNCGLFNMRGDFSGPKYFSSHLMASIIKCEVGGVGYINIWRLLHLGADQYKKSLDKKMSGSEFPSKNSPIIGFVVAIVVVCSGVFGILAVNPDVAASLDAV